MKWLFPTLLTAFVVLFRMAGVEYPELLNVTPLFAFFLCFRQDLKNYIHIPMAGYILSDVWLNMHYGVSTNWIHTLMMCAIFQATYLFGGVKNIGLLAKTFIVTTGFFVLSSTLAWIGNPAYGSGLFAWANAIVFGQPEYPPAYLFYLKSLVGNIGFAFLFDVVTKYQLSMENDNSVRLF